MHDPNIVQSKNFAAIVPLDYGPDREELSLIFASYDWSQLPELLKDPAGFFAAQSEHWEQEAALGTKHDWQLLTPSTVILQWVGKNDGGLMRASQVMAQTVPDEESNRKQAVANLSGHSGNVAKLASELRGTFPDGFFLAEFAFKTRILFIRYHPAEVRKTENGKKVRHFQGQFTNATANKLIPYQGGSIAASIHIDIGKTSEERAHFIMDFIEDAEAFFTEALAQAPEFFVGDVPLVQRKGKIQIKTIGKGKPPQVKMAHDIPYPTIYMETPSRAPAQSMKDDPIPPDEECLVCVMSNGEWRSPADPNDIHVVSTYTIGETVVKCYAPPGGVE